MAVLSRLLVGSQQRIDLADFLSIQSYVSSDFRELIRSFVGSSPFVLKGFDVINAPQSIGTTSISINVAESVLYDPTGNSGSFFSGLPEGNALSQPIVLGQELRANATNYVYLTLTSQGAAQDTRAFWDVDLNGGAGGEFNQTINTEAVLIAQAGVSTSGFPQGTVPVAKIVFGASSIVEITDCRNMMFRLGSGGTSPDPNNRFQFPTLPSAPYARSEPPSTINSSALPNPFQGGDKNIQTLKDWMDAVMTKLVELSGTTYWYESTGDLSLVKVYDDALGSSLKSKGKWQHEESVVGQVTWTEDITYRKMNDPRELIIRAGTRTLQNEQVMWIKMVRNQKINALDSSVTFINGASYVNGTSGSFQYLVEGDWIKAKGDSEYHYARVIKFCEAINGEGLPVDPSVALSVKLQLAYTGSSGASSAVYTKGVYDPDVTDDIRTSNRNSFEIYSAGGDMYWLANRSDTIQGISAVNTFSVTDADIIDADGASAKLVFSSAHSLSTGDRVVISDGSAFDGTYQVEKISNTEVSIETTNTGFQSDVTVRWAVVTTGQRIATASTFELESANHGFASGQKVTISGASTTTGGDINGSYLVNVRSDTQFQIPYDQISYSPSLSNASATCAKVILKTDLGSVEVVQGEEININEPDTQNLMSFIGMESLAETNPVYAVPDASNNMLHGYANYNSNSSDSLTTRVSRLTAMMADRVQDREIKISGRATFRNETSGSDQILTISGENLTITKPGSSAQEATWSSPYSLAQNKAIIIDIDRNASTSISPSVVDYDNNLLLQENRLILFYRTTDTNVYSWDGSRILNSSSWTSNDTETSQNKNIIVNEQVSLSYDGTKLIFNNSIGYVYVLVPGSSTYNRIDVSNFTSGIAIANDQSAWLRINRTSNKTFTNRQTSTTYQDSDAAGSVYVTSTGSVPTDQDVVVLYSIQNGKLIRHHAVPVERRKIYEEFFTVVSDSTGSVLVSLPVDSRNDGATAYYINGSAQLEVSLNGQIMKVNEDYSEVGTSGTAQSQITVTRELTAGDVIRFRLASEGGFYTIDVGTTTTLQQAYTQGRTITIEDGSPVVINSSPGYKALSVNGDLEVTGVIDPTGLALTQQAANPLGSDNGIWIDTSGNLNQARPGELVSSVNITQSIINPSSFLTEGNGIDITTATISVDLATDPGLEFSSGKLKTKIDPTNAIASTSAGLSITLNETNPGLAITLNKLDTKIDATRAITSDSNGLGVNLETTTPGLKITDNKLDVKLDATRSITSDSNGLGVNLETTTPGLKITDNKLDTKLDAARAITVNIDGLGINLETVNPSLKIDTNKLSVNLDSTKAIVSTSSGVGLSLETSNPGLEIVTNKLNTKLDAARAITSNSNGLGVNLETVTPGLKITDNKLDTKIDATRAITSNSSGLGVNLETSNPGLKITDNKLDVKLDASGAITAGTGGLSVAVDGTSIQIQSNQLTVAGVSNILSIFTNSTGSSIAVGTVVSALETTPNNITKTDAGSLSQGIKVVGVTYATINDGASGQVQTSGIATVINNSLVIGKPVYLNPSVLGGTTSTRPSSYGSPIISLGIAVDTNKVLLNPQLITINTHVYSETYVIPVGGIATDQYINLPTDSKSGGAPRDYLVGKGFLSLYLNGQLLEITEDYIEVGSVTGSSIQIKQDLVEGDKLKFVIDSGQAFMSAMNTM